MTTPDEPFVPPPTGEPIPNVGHATDRGKPGELSSNQETEPDVETGVAIDDALTGVVLARAEAAVAGAPTVDQVLKLAASLIKKNYGPPENVNRFTEWYYGTRSIAASWCFIGLSYILAHAGASQAAGLAIMGGKHAYVPDIRTEKGGTRHTGSPRRGDFCALFGYEHIEIVEKVLSATQVQTIGFNTENGDSDDAVARKVRNRSDVDMYFTPAYATTVTPTEDTLKTLVDLGAEKPQTVKAGSRYSLGYELEYAAGDTGKIHADADKSGRYPSIFPTGADAPYGITVEVALAATPHPGVKIAVAQYERKTNKRERDIRTQGVVVPNHVLDCNVRMSDQHKYRIDVINDSDQDVTVERAYLLITH